MFNTGLNFFVAIDTRDDAEVITKLRDGWEVYELGTQGDHNYYDASRKRKLGVSDTIVADV